MSALFEVLLVGSVVAMFVV